MKEDIKKAIREVIEERKDKRDKKFERLTNVLLVLAGILLLLGFAYYSFVDENTLTFLTDSAGDKMMRAGLFLIIANAIYQMFLSEIDKDLGRKIKSRRKE